MALQIRRGTDTQRQALSGVNTPIAGELLYTTDNKKLHIGDGTTAGGTSIGYFGSIAVSGQSTIKSTGVNEALTIVAGANISLVTDANTGTLTIAAAAQELNTGSLRLFQNNISSVNSNEDINIDPSGTGKVNVVGTLTATSLSGNPVTGELNISPTQLTSFGNNVNLTDGNVYISRNTHSNTFAQGFTFAQHHSTADAVNFRFYRTRGTGLTPTTVLDNDDLADIVFTGHDGIGRVAGATISVVVEGTPTVGNIPTKFQFKTNNGSTDDTRAELSAAGVWKVDSIAGLTTTLNITGNLTGSTVSVGGLRLFQNNITGLNSNEDIVIAPSGTGGVRVGGLRLFQNNLTGVNSNEDIVIDPSGTGKLQVLGNLTITGALNLAVYADATARNAAITSPTAGMIVFNTTGTKFQGYTGAAWVDLN